MAAADGMFDETKEEGMFELDTSRLAPGRYYVLIRGQDAAGNWGPGRAEFLDIEPPG